MLVVTIDFVASTVSSFNLIRAMLRVRKDANPLQRACALSMSGVEGWYVTFRYEVVMSASEPKGMSEKLIRASQEPPGTSGPQNWNLGLAQMNRDSLQVKPCSSSLRSEKYLYLK